MYYVDYLGMIASYFKPGLGSISVDRKLTNHKRLFVKKKNQNLIRPMFVSIFFLLLSIIVVPERSTKLVSTCEKYNSSAACQVW